MPRFRDRSHTNRKRPPVATILYSAEISSAGGGTSAASIRAAGEGWRLESLTTFNRLDGHADTGPGAWLRARR